jgi:hypothetical protein
MKLGPNAQDLAWQVAFDLLHLNFFCFFLCDQTLSAMMVYYNGGHSNSTYKLILKLNKGVPLLLQSSQEKVMRYCSSVSMLTLQQIQEVSMRAAQ